MHRDPLVVALVTALEDLGHRGVEITPTGDGWTVRLVKAEETRPVNSTDDDGPLVDTAGRVRRAW